MKKLVLNSYAKLNLYLEVLNKRPDCYHNIKTLFERIDLCDKITLKPRPDKKIKLTCNSADLPKGNSNLAIRAARLLQDSLDVKNGVEINLVKRIPLAAGLGGGSSNAGQVLIGLNKLWGLKLNRDKLVNYAQKIGCDVPFFIYNSPFAEARARGDKIEPKKNLNHVRLWHILVVPKIKVLTARIYKEWDSLKKKEKAGLTMPKYDVKILNLALRKKDFALMGKALFNSLEEITTNLYPEMRLIEEKLSSLGLKSILMSGSGPAIFGIVSSKKEAHSLCKQLQEELKMENRSWQVFVTRTC